MSILGKFHVNFMSKCHYEICIFLHGVDLPPRFWTMLKRTAALVERDIPYIEGLGRNSSGRRRSPISEFVFVFIFFCVYIYLWPLFLFVLKCLFVFEFSNILLHRRPWEEFQWAEKKPTIWICICIFLCIHLSLTSVFVCA